MRLLLLVALTLAALTGCRYPNADDNWGLVDDTERTDDTGDCTPEVCNGVDDDCDGDIDEDASDATTWYADSDSDGYGSATLVRACTEPDGQWAELPGDCADDDPARNPGATDTPDDSTDQDCNGFDATLCLTDADGDGFGVEPEVVSGDGQCLAERNQASAPDDCDDGNGATFPGATEICDGKVNACGGSLPANETDGDDDTVVECVFAQGVTAQNWGNVEIPAVAAGGDCDDSNATVSPLAEERCDGLINSCGATLPADELDDDDDGYVECTFEVDVNAGNWGNTEAVPVVGGDDCNDASEPPHPGASELCDGQANTCGTLPDNEVDNDDDGHVECAFANGITALNWGNVEAIAVTGGEDCDDAEATVFPGATERCDGQLNACGGAMLAGETDTDGDHYVACTIDAGGWDGPIDIVGGDDCDAGHSTVFPGADELCDGLQNNCANWIGTSPGTLPADERDTDGDDYVACLFDGVDENTWGDDSVTLQGDDDCRPDDAVSYPGAPERCDDIDNDCDDEGDDTDLDARGVASMVRSGDLWNNDVLSEPTYTAGFSGTLYLCKGVYETAILITSADLQIVGRYGAEDTHLSGDDSFRPLTVGGVGSGRTLGIEGLTVRNGLAIDGAGLYSDQDVAITLHEVTFRANEASGHGGAVYVTDGSLVVTDTVFDENSALPLTGNAYAFGGALASTVGATMTGGAFTDNHGDYGGAVFADSGTFTFEDVDFTGNVADEVGGGLVVWDSTVTLENCLLDNNDSDGAANAGGGGGAVMIKSGDLTILGSTLSNNDATPNDGGAILGWNADGGQPGFGEPDPNPTVHIEDSVLTGNTTGDEGAAIATHRAGTFSIVDTKIHGNTGENSGAIDLEGGADLSCEASATDQGYGVWGNTSNGTDGGAVSIQFNSDSTVTSDDCDWGTGGTNNSPHDIHVEDGEGYTEDYGNPANFTCDLTSCL